MGIEQQIDEDLHHQVTVGVNLGGVQRAVVDLERGFVADAVPVSPALGVAWTLVNGVRFTRYCSGEQEGFLKRLAQNERLAEAVSAGQRLLAGDDPFKVAVAGLQDFDQPGGLG